MKRFVIGTAGHIDHGKTTLVKALTGLDTDRLKEEKERGISIELGFAPFELPGGQKAAIVDMPGHERFIRHMLAGAFGIDIVLLTIAADEGVMPQTREHMDIIELLGVKQGIIVITKKDLVDEEWLALMEEEIKDYIDGTILRGSPIIAVSAPKGEGIQELLAQLEKMAGEVQEKPAFGQARLPIDRVFTISGFGTVVTGTLWSGKIHTGETLELMPVKRNVKIRTLQVHNEKVDDAYAGQRVAVNLQGIEVADIKRGYLLATPGYLTPSYRLDTRLHLLKTSPRSLKNWNRIRFHLGTDETLGRIVLLDRDEILPGEEAYAQIVMEKAVVAAKSDRFVVRFYSPVTTIGGGIIIDPVAPKQKRFREDVLDELAIKEEGSLYDILLHELETNPEEVLAVQELARRTGQEQSRVKEEMEQLKDDEKVWELKDQGYISMYGLQLINEHMVKTLEAYHKQYPLRPGYPREDMRSRFFKNINPKAFNLLIKYLEDQGSLNSFNNQLMIAGHQPVPGEKLQGIINQIVQRAEATCSAPRLWRS
ncbi:selenocysteine-specific translation elongation factor [Syntrophomonas palmitatica]|uniref:selenocysteine-specific translation elongation factor n=1 Tax=Syntrophomonas palmitatica TaxID=402877 RepID=UPI000A5184BE|nr:selenocysteine-specific translation elongation factor [Syntrophomonas palmitatica]